MQIHDLKPKNKIKKKKRVGRGGKRGTYSGRGMNGQKSRSGVKLAPIARSIIKKYPKLRGYNFSPLKKVSTVSIGVLDKVFDNGDVVSRNSLMKKGVIGKSKKLAVKILGVGSISKKITVEGCTVSDKAKEAIEKAGGSVK